MAWLRPGKQTSPLHSLDLFFVTQCIQLLARVALVRQILILTKYPNFPANSLSRALIITRDANNSDSSCTTLGDSVADFRPRRVQHAYKRDKCQVTFESGVVIDTVRMVVRDVDVRHVPKSKNECTEAIRSISRRAVKKFRLEGRSERNTGAVDKDRRASVKNRFWCTFDEEGTCAIVLDEDGHHLAVTREFKSNEASLGALKVVINGVGTGGRRQRFQGFGDFIVAAANLLC